MTLAGGGGAYWFACSQPASKTMDSRSEKKVTLFVMVCLRFSISGRIAHERKRIGLRDERIVSIEVVGYQLSEVMRKRIRKGDHAKICALVTRSSRGGGWIALVALQESLLP